MSDHKKILLIAGNLFFAVLFYFSWIFWKERHSFDAAHYLIELINSKCFFIAHQRPLGVVSQLLPLIGIWLNAPLVLVMHLYSIGDMLYYYLLFLLLYKLKDPSGMLAILLSILLTSKFTFYCPVSELLQGIALVPVLNGLLYRSFRFRSIVLLMLTGIIIFSHPLLFIPVAVLFLYYSIEISNMRAKVILWSGFLFFSLLKFLLLDTYDHQKTFYPVLYNDYGNVRNLKDVGFILSFLQLIVVNYTGLFILFLLTLLLIVSEKAWKQFLVFTFGTVAFLVLIIGTHHFTQISNYSERMLLPLTPLVVLPFAHFLFQSKKIFFILPALLLCFMILSFRIEQIHAAALPYSLRFQQMEELASVARSFGKQKVIADENILEQNSFAMSGWCYSIESTLLSALKGPDSCVSIAMQSEHIARIAEQGRQINPNSWIKWTEFILDQSTLNQQYFHFKKENYTALINSQNHSNQLLGGIKLNILSERFSLSSTQKFIKIKLSTVDIKPVYTNSLRIILEVFPENASSGFKTEFRLESDFTSEFIQFIPVNFEPEDKNVSVKVYLKKV